MTVSSGIAETSTILVTFIIHGSMGYSELFQYFHPDFIFKMAARIDEEGTLEDKRPSGSSRGHSGQSLLTRYYHRSLPELATNLTNLHELPFTSYNIHGEFFHEEIFIHEIRDNIVP